MFMTLAYRKKIFFLLIILMILFAGLCAIALSTSSSMIDLGLPDNIENKTIAVLSFLSLLLVVWDMTKI